MLTKARLAAVIDYTNLKPDATAAQIQELCKEAVAFGFASVCVNPSRAALARRLVEGSRVSVCVVIGFPLGADTITQKVLQAREMAALDIDELDMVVNIGAVKDGNIELVKTEIAAVREVFEDGILKVIMETCLLTDEEKVMVCRAANEAGADYVKTSTGFSTGGATETDVMLLKEHSGGLKVKASGGIRSFEDAAAMLAAGCDRIGTSSGIIIVSDPRVAAAAQAKTEY